MVRHATRIAYIVYVNMKMKGMDVEVKSELRTKI